MWRCSWMKSGRLCVKLEAAQACTPHPLPEGERRLPELTISQGLFARQFFQIGFNFADLIGHYRLKVT